MSTDEHTPAIPRDTPPDTAGDPAGGAEIGTAGVGRAGRVEAALVLLEQLGITPSELVAAVTGARTGALAARMPARMPTISEYLPRVAVAVSPATRHVYRPYWRRMEREWGARRLDEPRAVEIQQLAEHARAAAVVRRNSRGGRTAAAHLISAARNFYRHAEADGLITAADNPARKVTMPRVLVSTRRAIPAARLADIGRVVALTGNDPQLDTLILRTHIETACRRGGALALRPIDLDQQQCLVFLREKGETTRWQPVSPTLMRHLVAHAHERGAPPDGPLFRYRTGRPITARRYDYIFDRVSHHLPWAAAQGITAHWLRHTTLTWVERHSGYAVARAYAGHEGGLAGAGVTATYVRADVDEVAAALAALTGEPHPLAPDPTTTERGGIPGWTTVDTPPVWWRTDPPTSPPSPTAPT